MTVPKHMYKRNVTLSIQKYIGEKWGDTAGYPVIYGDDAEADPDGVQTGVSSVPRWATFRMVRNNTGSGLASSCQLDFMARIGTPGQQGTSAGARMATDVESMIDAFFAALSPFNRGFKVYDFTTTPATPVETRGRLQIEDPRGGFGVPDGGQAMPTIDNVRHHCVPFEVRHIQDWFGRPGLQFY